MTLVCTKHRHGTYAAAASERDRLLTRASAGDDRPIRVYHCRPCSESLGRDIWHVGHAPRRHHERPPE